MRLGEAIGLLKSDLVLDGDSPYIDLKPHPWRRLKTPGSKPSFTLSYMRPTYTTSHSTKCAKCHCVFVASSHTNFRLSPGGKAPKIKNSTPTQAFAMKFITIFFDPRELTFLERRDEVIQFRNETHKSEFFIFDQQILNKYPERCWRLMNLYLKVGAFEKKHYEIIENTLLRHMAIHKFRENLKNYEVVKIKIKDLKFSLAKFKFFEIHGNSINYTNKNPYIHDPKSIPYNYFIVSAIQEKNYEGGLFFDIGAHAGTYSILACAEGYEVVSVEMHPDMVSVIEINKTVNNFQKIHIVNMAAGKDGAVANFPKLDPRVGSKIWFNSVKKVDDLISVPTVSLDRLASIYGTPSIVKVDIEGNEITALEGAQNIIATMKTRFIFDIHRKELNDQGYPRDIFAKYFSDEKWKCVTLSKGLVKEVSTDKALDFDCVYLSARY